MTANNGEIILKADASLLLQSNCDLRFKRIGIDGFKEKIPFNDTQYGSAFHKFVSTMHESGGDFAKATFAAQELYARPCEIRPGKGHLNEFHLTKTCIDYWQYYQKKDNFKVFERGGKPFVEIDFSVPYCTVKLGDKVYTVLLEGTVDKGGKFERGLVCIGDYKTHSLWSVSKGNNVSAAIKAFFQQFELSGQLRFYTFVTKLLGQKEPDSIFGEFARGPIGAFIDGIFLSSKESTVFARSDIFMFSDADMLSYKNVLDRKITRYIELAANPSYDEMDGMVTGTCNEGKYPCRFADVCLARDPAVKQIVLTRNFDQRPYDPLSFGK